MMPFITFLRALAAMLITNAHYTGVYPTDLIANGGLLGDVLFFAVSGYCLYNIKLSFPKWYLKRIIRIFPALWIMTSIYLLTGNYSLSEHNILWWMIFPTYYHFVASIILLYIPYYFIIKYKKISGEKGERIPLIVLLSLIIQLIVYLFFYNKSYYHIDVVREPMIRFLFFDAMMIGAYFKNIKIAKNSIINWLIMIVLFITYFGSKLFFVKYESYSYLQILNQYALLLLLFMIFKNIYSINDKFNNMPKFISKIIEFIAGITLEIYLVQYVLIDLLRNVSIFPINWILITTSIIVSAYILHFISSKIQKLLLKENKS